MIPEGNPNRKARGNVYAPTDGFRLHHSREPSTSFSRDSMPASVLRCRFCDLRQDVTHNTFKRAGARSHSKHSMQCRIRGFGAISLLASSCSACRGANGFVNSPNCRALQHAARRHARLRGGRLRSTEAHCHTSGKRPCVCVCVCAHVEFHIDVNFSDERLVHLRLAWVTQLGV